MKRGRKPKEGYIRVCLKLNKDLYSLFKDECFNDGKTYSEVIESMIKKFVTKKYTGDTK